MPFATALYSTSVLDHDTIGFLCALQDTRLEPNKTTYPLVDLWSSRLPAQSESEKALTSNELFLTSLKPSLVQPFK